MADQELRKGVRILVSGGASSLDDEALEKVVTSCQIVQKERNPSSLSILDATYLQEYLALCDSFLNRGCDLPSANQRLVELNEKYSAINPSIRKSMVVGDHLTRGDSGWVPSEICW